MFCRAFGGFGGAGFGPGGFFNPGFMFLAMGLRLIIFVGIIVLAVKLFKKHSNNSGDTMRILNEKFALGEISEEEYLRRKTILKQKN